jgi:hypothetical protein
VAATPPGAAGTTTERSEMSKNYDDGKRDGAGQKYIDPARFHDEKYRKGLQDGRTKAIDDALLASKQQRGKK